MRSSSPVLPAWARPSPTRRLLSPRTLLAALAGTLVLASLAHLEAKHALAALRLEASHTPLPAGLPHTARPHHPYHPPLEDDGLIGNTTSHSHSDSVSSTSNTDVDVDTPGPAVSILVIWEGAFPFPALVDFFASIRANRPRVELVWIGVREDEQQQCLDIAPYAEEPFSAEEGASNIRAVCLTRREYWTAHRDYFCAPERWNCAPAEREHVLDVFIERNDKDRNKSLYRIWRGFIFREHMHPAAAWWGWADVDTFMGSFDRFFPWDVAPAFDVLIPGHPDNLLYLRGHLAFIQTRRETEERMNLYEDMRSVEGFVERHKDAWWCAEEAEFSAFVVRNRAITFLVLPTSLAEAGWGVRAPGRAALFATRGAVYALAAAEDELPMWPEFPLLDIPITLEDQDTLAGGEDENTFREGEESAGVTFGRAGFTRAVELSTDVGEDRGVWFPIRFATMYSTPPLPDGEEGRERREGWEGVKEAEVVRYVGRGRPASEDGGVGRSDEWAGGADGVWERVERRASGVEVSGRRRGGRGEEVRAVLSEGLYIHWMTQKYEQPRMFKALPMAPLRAGEVLAVWYGMDAAEVWDLNEPEGSRVRWRMEPAL